MVRWTPHRRLVELAVHAWRPRGWRQRLGGLRRGAILTLEAAVFLGILLVVARNHLLAVIVPALALVVAAVNVKLGRWVEAGHFARRPSLLARGQSDVLEQLALAGVGFRALAVLRMGRWGFLGAGERVFYRWVLPTVCAVAMEGAWLLAHANAPIEDERHVFYAFASAMAVFCVVHVVALPLRLVLPTTNALRATLRDVRLNLELGVRIENLQIGFLVLAIVSVLIVWAGLMLYAVQRVWGSGLLVEAFWGLAIGVVAGRRWFERGLPRLCYRYWCHARRAGEAELQRLVARYAEMPPT